MNQLDNTLTHKAVAYAVLHKDEMPENIKKFIEDLYEYEETGKRLQAVYNQTKESIKTIGEQMSQLYGSMDAVIKIIARELGPDKVNELGNKYQPSEDIAPVKEAK
jgi:hypothetical protein